MIIIKQLKTTKTNKQKNTYKKTMTAKEAVESLMAKDPKNPTIRSLKEQGL